MSVKGSRFFVNAASLAVSMCFSSLNWANSESTEYHGSRFKDIKKIVFSEPLAVLPNYQVSTERFGPKKPQDRNALLKAAVRTLRYQGDVFSFPHQQKLLQPNGICLSGRWLITESSNYMGQFKQGTDSLLLARASVALSGTTAKDKRAFGLALKIFPTQNKTKPVKTLNAFVMNSLGGVKVPHVYRLSLTNEPELGALPAFFKVSEALRIRSDLIAADRLISEKKGNYRFRPIQHLGQENDDKPVLAPYWLRLSPDKTIATVDQDDFRHELNVEHYPNNTLIWWIEVAEKTSKIKSPKKAEWRRIGKVLFNESIVSKACDQQLHFAHPKL